MIKSLKIGGERVPVKYKTMDEPDAGEYEPETGSISIQKTLKCHEHDETLIHEMVHALQHITSLRHLGLSDEAWEMIAGEVGKAVADNFFILPR
jgi:hypothetical protein